MRFFKDAISAVDRNLSALFLFIAIFLPASVIKLVCDIFLERHYGIDENTDVLPPLLHVYHAASLMLIAAFSAAARSTAFARLAARLDFPRWRISGHKEALRRFFLMWFVLDVIAVETPVLVLPFVGQQLGMPEFAGALFYLWVAYVLLIVPVGTCVMFHGHFRKTEAGEIFQPLLERIGPTLAILVISFVALFFQMVLLEVAKDMKVLYPLIDIAFVYLECVFFAAYWLICLDYRDNNDDTLVY